MPKIGKIITVVILLLVMVPTMGLVWVKDGRQNPEYCAGCHQDPYYTTWKDSDSLAHYHAELSISCQTCHDRTMTESMDEMLTYVQGDYKNPLREQRLPKEDCLKCHGSYEELIPLTDPAITGAERNPHEGHNGELDCGMCHNMHRDSVDFCSECHAPVTDSPGWVQVE